GGKPLPIVTSMWQWQIVKCEEVYLKDYTGVLDAIGNLKAYFRFYNRQRPHQALNYQTPEAVYFGVNATKTAMLRIGLAADRRSSENPGGLCRGIQLMQAFRRVTDQWF